MRTELKTQEIVIPQRLNAVVEESLREVGKLRRRSLGKRAAACCGSVLAFVGAFLVFGFTNPALASQIPLVGGLFQQANTQSKQPGATNIEGYGAVQPVGKRAETENEECSLTVTEAYSDGYTVQIGLQLDAPEEFAERYEAIDTAYGVETEAEIGGDEAQVSIVNPFYLREGKWTSTMTLQVPQARQGEGPFAVALKVKGLSGRKKAENGSTYGASEPLAGMHSVEFPVTVDKAHEFAFSCNAEENGAKLLSVAGTPAQTVLSVERPYWGEATPNMPEDGALGYPLLYTLDGEKVEQLASRSAEEGGWDYESRETLRADLYYDGLPAGTKQAVFRIYDSHRQEEVLAEFTIDLEKQTASPTETYREEGPLKLREPTHYEILQAGNDGEEQNGYCVRSVVFSNLHNRYTGQVFFSFPEEQEGKRLKAEVFDSQNRLLFSTESRREDGTWNEEWTVYEMGERFGGKEYSAFVTLNGARVPVGETVTTKISELESGETVCTDTRTLTSVQY